MKTLEIKEVEGEIEIKVETGFWIFKEVAIYRRVGLVKGGFVWVKRLSDWSGTFINLSRRHYNVWPEDYSMSCRLDTLIKAGV